MVFTILLILGCIGIPLLGPGMMLVGRRRRKTMKRSIDWLLEHGYLRSSDDFRPDYQEGKNIDERE